MKKTDFIKLMNNAAGMKREQAEIVSKVLNIKLGEAINLVKDLDTVNPGKDLLNHLSVKQGKTIEAFDNYKIVL